jgi:hypothetical protein
MIVNENVQVLAHNKHMEQLLVNELEVRDGPVLPRIMDGKRETGRLSRFDWSWSNGQIQVILHRIGQAGYESHSTTRALSWIVRSNIGIHRANVNVARILRWKRRRSLSGSDQRQDQ